MTVVATGDLKRAQHDLDEYGYCLVEGALSGPDVARYKAALQSAAGGSRLVLNLIGHAPDFLDLVQHPTALRFADHQLGPEFLLSGVNGVTQLPKGTMTRPMCRRPGPTRRR